MVADSPISLKRGFLYALIGSTACSALLGMATVAFGDFGDLETRILLTTLTVSVASIGGLSCGAALESGRARVIPTAGVVLSILAAVLITFGIWAKVNGEEFWKSAATCSVLAASCSHVSLLLLARLSSRFQWAVLAAQGASFAVAAVIIAMLWGDGGGEGIFRVLGVAAILDAAMTVLVPVLHRLSRADLSNTPAVSLAEIDREIQQLEVRLNELKGRRMRLLA